MYKYLLDIIPFFCEVINHCPVEIFQDAVKLAEKKTPLSTICVNVDIVQGTRSVPGT